jgi:hypothetical protein
MHPTIALRKLFLSSRLLSFFPLFIYNILFRIKSHVFLLLYRILVRFRKFNTKVFISSPDFIHWGVQSTESWIVLYCMVCLSHVTEGVKAYELCMRIPPSYNRNNSPPRPPCRIGPCFLCHPRCYLKCKLVSTFISCT